MNNCVLQDITDPETEVESDPDAEVIGSSICVPLFCAMKLSARSYVCIGITIIVISRSVDRIEINNWNYKKKRKKYSAFSSCLVKILTEDSVNVFH